MGVIRGAICAENSQKDISNKAVELIEAIFDRNNLSPDDIDAVIFSATSDLNTCYPAKTVREHFAMSNVAFMCVAEMSVEGSLDHCLRVAVFAPKISQCSCKHCYIGRASSLRKDLSD